MGILILIIILGVGFYCANKQYEKNNRIAAVFMFVATIVLGIPSAYIYDNLKPLLPYITFSTSTASITDSESEDSESATRSTSDALPKVPENLATQSSTESISEIISEKSEDITPESVIDSVQDDTEDDIPETEENEQKENEDKNVIPDPKAMIGDVSYPSLQSAIDDSVNGDSISVISDIHEDLLISAGKNITIELNDYTITNASESTFCIEGDVTVIGGAVDNISNGESAVTVERSGSAVFKDCTIKRSQEKKGNTYYTIVNRGVLNCKTCDIQNGDLKQYKNRKSAILNGYTHAGEAVLDYSNNKNKVKAELTITGSKIYGGNNGIRNGVYSVLYADGCDINGYEHAFSNRGEATVLNSNLYGVESVFCDKREDFQKNLVQFVQINNCVCSSEDAVFFDNVNNNNTNQTYVNVLCDFKPNVDAASNGDGTYIITQ